MSQHMLTDIAEREEKGVAGLRQWVHVGAMFDLAHAVEKSKIPKAEAQLCQAGSHNVLAQDWPICVCLQALHVASRTV